MNFLGYGLILSTLVWTLFQNRQLLMMYGIVLGIYIITYLVKTRKALKMVRRKVQIASWDEVGDPSVYGQIEFDMTEVNKAIELNNKQNDKTKLKKIHFGIRALGQM